MNISELTQDGQVHLYNRLHLKDCFRLRAMCRTLNAAFFVDSATRHSLIIKISPNEEATDRDDLACSKLDREIVDFLLTTFPSITDLAIRLSGGENSDLLEQMAYLLTGWSSKLKSLKLDLDLHRLHPEESLSRLNQNMNHLLDSINGMSVLTSFNFKVNPYYSVFHFNLTILGKLEHFSFDSPAPVKVIYDSLLNYAQPNTKLQTISLHGVGDYEVDTEEEDRILFLSLDADLTKKFTSLGENLFLDGPELSLFAPKFTSLKYLCVSLDDAAAYLPLDRVTAILAEHMSQLESLRLEINFDYFLENPQPCTPLPSVKTLYLEFSMTSHDDIRIYLTPAETFPNLENASTDIYHFTCIECQINNDAEDEEEDDSGEGTDDADDEAKEACRVLLERPFEECTKFSGPVIRVLEVVKRF